MSLSIADFHKGDTVYHLSNTKVKMVVIDVSANLNEVKCRWVDSKGQLQVMEFMPEELGKTSDLLPKFRSL